MRVTGIPRQNRQHKRPQDIYLFRGVRTGIAQGTVFNPRHKAMPHFKYCMKNASCPKVVTCACGSHSICIFPLKVSAISALITDFLGVNSGSPLGWITLGGKIMAQLKEYEPYRFYAFVQLRFLGLSKAWRRDLSTSLKAYFCPEYESKRSSFFISA